MLGSVVNTLEQRGEWLNGGRGAAKGMIDRLSANQVTPFGAAEHSEFLEPVMFWGLREWLLAGGDGRKPARMKGLQMRGHIAVVQVCSAAVTEAARRAYMCTVTQAPAEGNMALCRAAHPRWLVCNPGLTSAVTSGENRHRIRASYLSPIWRPLLSDTFFLFASRLS